MFLHARRQLAVEEVAHSYHLQVQFRVKQGGGAVAHVAQWDADSPILQFFHHAVKDPVLAPGEVRVAGGRRKVGVDPLQLQVRQDRSWSRAPRSASGVKPVRPMPVSIFRCATACRPHPAGCSGQTLGLGQGTDRESQAALDGCLLLSRQQRPKDQHRER